MVNMKSKSMANFEDFIKLGRYHMYFVLVMEFVIIAELTNMVFMVFGGAIPTIVSCGDVSFRNMTDKKAVCQELKTLKLTSNCTPEVEEEFISINYEWDLLCEGEDQVHNSLSVQMVGVMIGALVFGQISDLYGRKWTVIGTLTCLCGSGAASAFSTNLHIFFLFRAVIGFFLGGVMTVMYVFFVEILPYKHRLWIKTLVTWSPSYIVFSLLAYFTGTWRVLAVASNLLAAPGIILICFLNESPRWLIQQGRQKEAEDSLRSIAKWNRCVVDEDELKSIVEKEIVLNKQRHTAGTRYFFHHLFYSWKLMRYTAVMMIAWFTTGCISYGLLFNLGKLSGSLYLNSVFYGLVRYATAIIIAALDYFVKKIGRKVIQSFCLSVIIICFSAIFAVTYFEVSTQFASYVRILSLCAAAMTSPLWLLAYLLTAELYPTAVRNLANGYASTWARVAGIVAPQILSTSKLWAPAPYLVLILMAVVDLVAFDTMLPETKGKPLPEHMPPPEKCILNSCTRRGRAGAQVERTNSFTVYKFNDSNANGSL
uniref:Major facilitator superfamily (MFS) profile domain-containing protein n=1 Tax=Plectus sambesii TaxID=2011161 RepID=A0A914WPH9_9BILA